jgi:DNA (cytosine-5)-methyltransferase 1
MTWRTPAEHLAWLHRKGRNQPSDLQAAVLLLRAQQATAEAPPGAAGERLLPTPDTGTSPNGHGRRGGRPGNGHHSGHDLNAAVRQLPRPGTVPPPGPGQATQPPAGGHAIAWGPYEAAIRRHERMLGCPAPPPAETGPSRQPRLTAAFTEWLMGIPGWVTGIEGIPRTAQLRILGNGVVPQQAACALRLLLQAAAFPPEDAGQAPAGGAETAA